MEMSVIRKWNEPVRPLAVLACLLVASCEVGNLLPSSCISGEQAYNSENYKRAIEDLSTCIATRGDILTTENLATVYQFRGAAYRNTLNYDRAIQDLNEAIRLEPGFGEAHYNLGATYHEMGQDERAIQDYDNAVALEPNVGFPLIGRGNSYLVLGDVDRAFRDYDRAIRLEPSFVNFRGNAYFLLGKFGEASQDYRWFLEQRPTDAHTALYLYIGEVRNGQTGTDSLTRNAANLNMSEWPAPVVPLFLKEMSPEQVLEKARGSENQQAQLCDAYFFIG